MRQKQTTVQMFCEKHLENISDMFRTLYRDEQLADVTLYCREGSLKAHKLILAASSPYFQKIFLENANDKPIIFMHGIGLDELKNLVDLMYKGAADVPADNVDAMYDIVDELQIIGILQDESRSTHTNEDTPRTRDLRNRDTRFRGLKRVAVDYSEVDETFDYVPSKRTTERVPSTSNSMSRADISHPDGPSEPSNSEVTGNTEQQVLAAKKLEAAVQKTNLWNKKPRKYKCELCPSSFKRASHLTRHQLVHTAHEDIDLYNTIGPEWTGHLQTVDPHEHLSCDVDPISGDSHTEGDSSHLELLEVVRQEIEPPTSQNGGSSSPPIKKARGRPRKHAKDLGRDPYKTQWKIVSVTSVPLIKKRRGRPKCIKDPLRTEVGKIKIVTDQLGSKISDTSDVSKTEPSLNYSMLNVKKKRGRKPNQKDKIQITPQGEKLNEHPKQALQNQLAINPVVVIKNLDDYRLCEMEDASQMKKDTKLTASKVFKRKPGRPKGSKNTIAKGNRFTASKVIKRKVGRPKVSKDIKSRAPEITLSNQMKDPLKIDKDFLTEPRTQMLEERPNVPLEATSMSIGLQNLSVPPGISVQPMVETSFNKRKPFKKRPGRPPTKFKAPPPLVKRGRGRPRIHPVSAPLPSIQQMHPPKQEMQPHSSQPKVEQYDFTNLPFGDIEYLTRPLRETLETRRVKESNVDEQSIHHEAVLEPVVQIKMEPEDREEVPAVIEQEQPPAAETTIISLPPAIATSLPPEITALPAASITTLPAAVTTLPAAVTSLPAAISTLPITVVNVQSEQQQQATMSKAPEVEVQQPTTSFEKKVVETTSKLTKFENQIAKIGECTISVANV